MEYQDFEISIERDGANAWRKRVIHSPAGQGSDPFVPPFATAKLAEMLDRLGSELLGAVPGTRDLHSRQAEGSSLAPMEIGKALYRALLSGEVGARYEKSCGHAESAGEGLRMKLRFDPGSPSMTWVQGLPWELLCDPETEEFLVLDLQRPLVRYLEVERSAALPAFKPPLRVLIALANPLGSAALDLRREQAKIEEALNHSGQIEPVFIENATVEKLREAIRSQHFHVFHFLGHGTYDESTGQGSLLLETSGGGCHPVSGEVLALVIKGTSLPHLAVLNACRTSRGSTSEGLSPFGSVAAALVRKGVPAVVAMQFPVSDVAAIAFAGALYSRIAVGEPVDTAVGEGRMAILLTVGSTEWATPSLFLRTPDGRLFDCPYDRSAKPAPSSRANPGGELPPRIGTIHANQVNYAERDIHQVNNFPDAEPPER